VSSQQLVDSNEKITKILLFTDLHAWQESHVLVKSVYEFLADLPKEERFGLADQLRRASISITSNIAEGFSRRGAKEKMQFYYIALGSLTEVQNQLILAKDVGYMDEQKRDKMLEQSVLAQKLLNGLIRSIREC
jgi:four helix bundle protein